MIEHGSGPALVLVPGLPGPRRYVAPTFDALATRFHALTMSLGPECTIESDVTRIVAALDERRIDRAVICGISLGGLIALRFAAQFPQRTAALVLASTPGPGARLRPRHRLYTAWPWLFGPIFVAETPFMLSHDLRWSLLKRLGAPVSFAKMAKRARLIESPDTARDCASVTAPTLVVTGERAYDRVVPVDSTLQYLRAIPGSQHIVLDGTGHLGSITHAREFAEMVTVFVERAFQARGGGPERAALRTA